MSDISGRKACTLIPGVAEYWLLQATNSEFLLYKQHVPAKGLRRPGADCVRAGMPRHAALEALHQAVRRAHKTSANIRYVNVLADTYRAFVEAKAKEES